MNEALFDFVNGLAGTWPLLDSAARFFANQAIYVLGLILAALGLVQFRRDRRRAISVAVVAGVALLTTGALILIAGHLITESRPFVGDPDTRLLITHAANNGFPSDHAAVAAAVAGVGILAWPRWTALLVALVIAIGIARVFVGVHLPGDVVAGWAGGGLAAVSAWLAARRLAPRRWRWMAVGHPG